MNAGIGKLSFDETKIYVIREIDGVKHKVTIGDDGKEILTRLDDERPKERET